MNSSVDSLLGAVIEDRYRIDAQIARGGMSAVYLGVDLRLGRDVAVKVMDTRYSGDPEFLRRFEFEARAVAGLKHPGLVAVYDQGIDDRLHSSGIAFLVMELVQGGSLRELLRERGPMPPHAVVAVADPVLGGLGTAHAAGLVHRDVKPENVLISDSGEVKVADFGLVRAVAEAGVTSASVILGTAAYLSPEQVESTHADARSDVYSMGVMMFELLTGRTPFRGDSPLALAYQRLTYDVPAPGDVIRGVPEEIDAVVMRATERNPADRYNDAFEMRNALLTVADELDLPPFTVPAPHRSAERDTLARLRAEQRADPHWRPQQAPPARTERGPEARAAGDFDDEPRNPRGSNTRAETVAPRAAASRPSGFDDDERPRGAVGRTDRPLEVFEPEQGGRLEIADLDHGGAATGWRHRIDGVVGRRSPGAVGVRFAMPPLDASNASSRLLYLRSHPDELRILLPDALRDYGLAIDTDEYQPERFLYTQLQAPDTWPNEIACSLGITLRGDTPIGDDQLNYERDLYGEGHFTFDRVPAQHRIRFGTTAYWRITNDPSLFGWAMFSDAVTVHLLVGKHQERVTEDDFWATANRVYEAIYPDA